MIRKILHLDLDAFFCAVEELRDPGLRGIPFAVGGRPEERGVVASCSYPARVFGVRSAMPMGRALKLCPGLRIQPGDYSRYSHYSKEVMLHLRELTPLVEQISIDEAFLDASGLPEEARLLAESLQERIRHELSLPCSIGAATNKLLAKIANDVGKVSRRSTIPPCAITIVPPGQEAAFLAPLPVDALWGVGPKTAERLNEMGIRTIGDLASFPPARLAQVFGKPGWEMARHAQGIDERPIITEHEIKSVSQETTFVEDVRDEAELRRTVQALAEGVGRRLRASGHLASTIKLKLRWPDFTTLTRQATLPQPSDRDEVIFAIALDLLLKNRKKYQAVRLIGVGASNLCPPARQLSLWDQPAAPVLERETENARNERDRRLESAVDELRRRFGESIVQRGTGAKKEGGEK